MVVWWIRSAERLWTRAFCTQHHTLEHGHNDTSGGAAAQGHERRRLPAGGARQSEGLVELTSLSASNAARIAARGHHQVARHAACQAARHAAARRTTKRTRARRLVAGGAHGVSSHASIASVTSASRASTKHRAHASSRCASDGHASASDGYIRARSTAKAEAKPCAAACLATPVASIQSTHAVPACAAMRQQQERRVHEGSRRRACYSLAR